MMNPNSNNILPPSMMMVGERVSSPSPSSSAPSKELGDLWNMDLSDILNLNDRNNNKKKNNKMTPPSSVSLSAAAPTSPLRRSKTCEDTPAMMISTQAGKQTVMQKKKNPPTQQQQKQQQEARKRSPPPTPVAGAGSSRAPAPAPAPAGRGGNKDRDRHIQRGVRKTRSNDIRRVTVTTASTRRTRSKSPLRHLTSFGGTLSRTRSNGTTTSKDTDDGNGEPLKRTVSFDKVQIREFQQILSDNPPCSKNDNGPSIGLGWNYYERKDTDLDKYESKRNSKGNKSDLYYSMLGLGSSSASSSSSSAAEKSHVTSLSAKAREDIALSLGYSWEEIERNKRQNEKIQRQRKKTLKEDIMMSAAAGKGTLGGNDGLLYNDPVAIMQAARVAHGFVKS